MPIRITTLGALRVHKDVHEITWSAQNRARPALLAYLGLEREATRASVMSVFWPESDEEKARHALSQAIYRLRQTLGDEHIEVQGDRIRVSAEVTCDAQEFEEAVERDGFDRALELYSGPFLQGVDGLPDSKGFETWVDARRARIERLHRRARRGAVQIRAKAGDFTAAINVARRWVEADPLEDEARHQLIELLAATGQRNEAIREYEQYERLLATDDLRPLDATTALVATLRAQPAPPVERGTTIAGTSSSETPVTIPASWFGKVAGLVSELQRRHVLRVTGAYVLLAAGLVQLADTIGTLLHLPGGFATGVLIVAALGLPLVIFFSWTFDVTAQGIRLTAPNSGMISVRTRSVSAVALIAATVFATATLLAPWAYSRYQHARAIEATDPNSLLVLPMRVLSVDPDDLLLREAAVHLWARFFSGETGLIAVDASTALYEWAKLTGAKQVDVPLDTAIALATRLRAGRVLTSHAVVTLGKVVVTAMLYDVRHPDAPPKVAKEEGPHGDPVPLFDRLAIELIGVEAGERQDRIALLVSTSPPAVLEYFQGERATRAGKLTEATDHFLRALEIDSTFALAGLRLFEVGMWGGTGTAVQNRTTGLRFALANRHRLTPRDTMFITILQCPGSINCTIDGFQAAATQYPSDPRMWFSLGDWLFHYGDGLGYPRALERAEAALTKAMDLGHPYIIEPLLHRLELAVSNRDSTSVRSLEGIVSSLPESDWSSQLRWLVRAGSSDTITLAKMSRDQYPGFTSFALSKVAAYLINFRMSVDEAERVARLGLERAKTEGDRLRLLRSIEQVVLNAGRPARANPLTGFGPAATFPDSVSRAVLHALYWQADSLPVSAAVSRLKQWLAALPADSVRPDLATAHCAVELWRISRGDTATTRLGSRKITSFQRFPVSDLCPWFLNVELALITGYRADLSAAVVALEEWTSKHYSDFSQGRLIIASLLVLAKGYEGLGDDTAALASVRRRARDPESYAVFRSTFLREEGRLAEKVGDTAGALEAYRHYLWLRQKPDATIKPEVDRIKATVAALEKRGVSARRN